MNNLETLNMVELVNANNLDLRLILNDLNARINNKYTILYSKIDACESIGTNKSEIMIKRIFQRTAHGEEHPTKSRLIQLIEFTNIFRNCLESVYEYRDKENFEVNDILFIKPYTIDEIICSPLVD